MTPATGQPASFWGVGPRIGVAALIYFLVALGIDDLLAPRLRIHLLTPRAAAATGTALIVVGTALYLYCLRALLYARRGNQLMTTGPYRLVRHPLYAIGLFFLAPGVCILLRSWLVITTPLAMAVAIAWFIPQEERTLEGAYGQAYRDYRERTGAVLPRW